MTIYIVIPSSTASTVTDAERQRIQQLLVSALRNYYGLFPSSAVQFSDNQQQQIAVIH